MDNFVRMDFEPIGTVESYVTSSVSAASRSQRERVPVELFMIRTSSADIKEEQPL